MSRESRIAALERRRGADFRRGPPPEFFDRMVNDRATAEEWARWTPWMMLNLPALSNKQVEQLAKATGIGALPEDPSL